MARLRAQCVRERRLMCGAPHLPIHSSFRSAVFDSACQLRVSIHLGLGAAECPRGRSAPRRLSSPVCSPRTAPIARGSNTISYEEPASGAPSPRRRERAKAHGNRSRGDHIAQPPACCARASRAPGRSTPTSGAGAPGRRHRLARAAGTTNAFNRFKLVHRPAPGSAFAPREPGAAPRTNPHAAPPPGPTSDGSPRPAANTLWCVVPAQPPWRVGPPRAGARTRPASRRARARAPRGPTPRGSRARRRARGSAGDVPGAGVIVVRGGGAPASRVKIDGRFL